MQVDKKPISDIDFGMIPAKQPVVIHSDPSFTKFLLAFIAMFFLSLYGWTSPGMSSGAEMTEPKPMDHSDSVSRIPLLDSASSILLLDADESPGDLFATPPEIQVFTICMSRFATLIVENVNATLNLYKQVIWNMGDGQPSITQNIPASWPNLNNTWMNLQYKYANSGNFTITLTLIPYSGSNVIVTKAVVANPLPPDVTTLTPVKFCLGSTASPLSATGTSGNNVVWYTPKPAPASGYDRSSTPPTPSTSVIGSSQFFLVGQENPSTTCESNLTRVTIEIVDAPTGPPLTSSLSLCVGGTGTLSSSVTNPNPRNFEVKWYDQASGGTPRPSVPSIPPSTTTYYVSLNSLTGCGESGRAPLTVTINPTPAAPSIPSSIPQPAEICQDFPITPALLNSYLTGLSGGNTFLWYASATGGTGTTTPPTIPTTGGLLTPNSYSFFVSQRMSTAPNCESSRTPLQVQINPLPSATLSAGAVICQGASQTLEMRGASGTAGYTFSYRLNGTATTINSGNLSGNASDPAVITVPTATATTYTYELTRVEDGKGCAKSLSASTAVFRVNATPRATLAANTPISGGEICTGKSATFTFTGSGASSAAAYTFSYSIDGVAQTPITTSGSSASIATPAINFPSAGSKSITLSSIRYTDVATCSDNTPQTLPITVNRLPGALASIDGGATSPLLLCQETASPTVRFTGNTSLGPYTFTYKLNAGADQTVTTVGTDPSHTFPIPTSAPGSFAYTLQKVVDSKGCEQSQTGSATVRIVANPDVTITGTTAVCQNETRPTITFQGANGITPYTFTYAVNGGPDQTTTSSGGNVATIQADTNIPGTFIYALKQVSYTDGITCSKTLTTTAAVTVHDLPSATLTAASPSIVICQGLAAPQLRFSGSDGLAPYTFRYQLNTGILTGTGNPVLVNASTAVSGNFRYQLMEVRDARNCSQPQSGTVDVTVTPKPDANAGSTKYMALGTNVALDGSATRGTGLVFAWSPATGLSNPTLPNPVASPTATTRYLLTVTSSGGCIDTSSALVTVLNRPIIPNTFTPNGDGINDRWEILNLGTYPDPVVEIYSDRGQLIFQSFSNYKPWDGTYKGKPLPVGTYYFVIFPKYGIDRIASFVTLLR